jgi:hypothetical protein
VDVDSFIERYPRLFHMADAGTWPKIQRDGLRSTTALLDLYEYTGTARHQIESERRAKSVVITHSKTGETAVIRDNIPLREQFLRLDDMTPTEWYELLNRKVFFWVSEERLTKLLNARQYKSRPHDVLTIDTGRLLDVHSNDITVASINTGATLYPNAPKRGPQTFRKIADHSAGAVVVELAVDYAVPRIADLVTVVQRRLRADVEEELFRASTLS